MSVGPANTLHAAVAEPFTGAGTLDPGFTRDGTGNPRWVLCTECGGERFTDAKAPICSMPECKGAEMEEH